MYVLTFTRSFNICSIKLLSECLTSFHIYIWHKLDCYAELLSSQIKIKEIKKIEIQRIRCYNNLFRQWRVLIYSLEVCRLNWQKTLLFPQKKVHSSCILTIAPRLTKGTPALIKIKLSPRYYLNTAQTMKFSIHDFFRKCNQIRRKLLIQSHLLKKSLIENLIEKLLSLTNNLSCSTT